MRSAEEWLTVLREFDVPNTPEMLGFLRMVQVEAFDAGAAAVCVQAATFAGEATAACNLVGAEAFEKVLMVKITELPGRP